MFKDMYDSPASQSRLRVASYNVRKCIGLDRRRRPERTLAVLRATMADIVAVQEADRRLGSRPAALPMDMIRAETDYRAVDPGKSDVSLGWHGNALLLRDDMTPSAVDAIDLPGLEPRGALIVDIEGPCPIRVVATHLGLRRRDRRAQLQTITSRLAQKKPRATVILGDFNEWSLARGLEPLAGRFTIHSPGKSFHAARPVAALDRIALCDAFRLEDAGVHETRHSAMASDHLPVWADIALEPAPVT